MNQVLSKRQLRKSIRKQRASLTNMELVQAEHNLAIQAKTSNRLLQARRILSYAPFAGEISPASLVNTIASKSIHYPRITNFRLGQMQFYAADKIYNLNRYGIEEPKAIGKPRPANSFDLLLIPLVAFDRSGTRMGMGAGYYDRALEALGHQTSTKPYLVGLAHHFQEVKSLERAPWDVPLDAILTDHEFIHI